MNTLGKGQGQHSRGGKEGRKEGRNEEKEVDEFSAEGKLNYAHVPHTNAYNPVPYRPVVPGRGVVLPGA